MPKKIYEVTGYSEYCWTTFVEADSEEEAERIIVEETALSDVNIKGGQGMVAVYIEEKKYGKQK